MKETRVFLGNAPWYKTGYYGVRAGSRWPHFEKESIDYYPFPFFLAYAHALLEKKSFPTLLIDAVPEHLSESVFLDHISHFQPDIVLLETSTASLLTDLHIAKEIRQINNHCTIVFCGPHYHMYKEQFLKDHPVVDMVLVGEYEFTLLDIACAYENNESCDNIPGILYRDKKNNTVKKTPPRPLVKDIDQFPWPSRDHLPMAKYQDYLCGIPQPSLQMWASRGCPYQCSFCFWPHVMYNSSVYRLRSPEDILNEIDHCLKTYPIRSVYFDDDTFNINKEHVMAIAQGFIDRHWDIPWGIMARADHMDEEMLEKLAESNLWGVKYGIESGVQKIVDQCGKKLDLQKVRRICRITRESGIKMHLTFTFGLPGETRDTALKTLDFALEMNPDSVQFSIATPFPGSRFYDEMQQNGRIISHEWEHYDGYNKAVIVTEHLAAHELEEIRRYADDIFSTRDRLRRFYPRVYRRDQIEALRPLLPELEENRVKLNRFRKNRLKYFFKALINPCWLIRKIREYIKHHQIQKKAGSYITKDSHE